MVLRIACYWAARREQHAAACLYALHAHGRHISQGLSLKKVAAEGSLPHAHRVSNTDLTLIPLSPALELSLPRPESSHAPWHPCTDQKWRLCLLLNTCVVKPRCNCKECDWHRPGSVTGQSCAAPCQPS